MSDEHPLILIEKGEEWRGMLKNDAYKFDNDMEKRSFLGQTNASKLKVLDR